ncbi:MAG: RNA polymerase sigma factor [Peptococcaceae bacterium]|nr:RNA polymerase sigma factor [Peptococcaceae bacterium]
MADPDIASLFNEIYSSTNKATLAFITAKCRHTADISDIFQDTYMELYNALAKRGAGYVTNTKALVLRIASRKIAKYYSWLERLRMRELPNSPIYVSEDSTDDDEMALSDFAADSFLTEDFAVNQILLESAKAFIHSKPEDVQKVFYLMYDVDLTIPEIARILDIGESNVKNKLYRTLKELRHLLSEGY